MLKLHHDETATILAALRLYQSALVAGGEVPPAAVASIATNDGDVTPLDSAGVDDLCERINVGDSPSPVDHKAMVEQIHALLDGDEWDSDTMSEVAGILTDNGYKIRGPDENPEGNA